MPSPAALGELLGRQAETLQAMADVTVKQREALREGRLELLQDLFRELQNLGFSAEALENHRGKMAARLAEAAEVARLTYPAICGRLNDPDGLA